MNVDSNNFQGNVGGVNSRNMNIRTVLNLVIKKFKSDSSSRQQVPFNNLKKGEITPNGVSKDDCIIAVMGPTGAGKSRFIQHATGSSGDMVGHKLKSHTSQLRAIRVAHPENPKTNVVFIDTPGFDNTNKADTEILRMIADWLKATYKNDIHLAGLIYFHRISDNRMSGTPLKNLTMFRKLCGHLALGNVVLVSTMWDRVPVKLAERRQQELEQKYWRSMLEIGSSIHRSYGTPKDAWHVVDSLIVKTRIDALLVQEELVKLKLKLNETQAGIALYDSLQQLLVRQKETVRKLREDAEKNNNEQLIKELTAQYEAIQNDLAKTFEELQSLKIGFFRRTWLLLRPGKTDARVV